MLKAVSVLSNGSISDWRSWNCSETGKPSSAGAVAAGRILAEVEHLARHDGLRP